MIAAGRLAFVPTGGWPPWPAGPAGPQVSVAGGTQLVPATSRDPPQAPRPGGRHLRPPGRAAGLVAGRASLAEVEGCRATIFAQMGTIRVALAEDNVLLREGVSRLVAASEDFELVGTASDLPELLAVIEQHEPDVVITDIRMPPTGRDEGIQAAAWLRDHRPQVGVVVLSQYTAPGYAVALLEHGSAGRAYLLKERVASVDELARAVRTVARGGSVIDPVVVDELVKSRSHPRASSLDSLTPREAQILAEMAQGKNNAAIATALTVSERAVEKHTNSIFAKLGLNEEKDVNRRVKAVLLFLSRGEGG